MEKVTASGSQARPSTVSDFRRLHPTIFTGEEPLDAEQWLIDTENLLIIAHVPEADRADVVKIQLTRVARSWWLAHLQKPICWEKFSETFLAKFFPDTAKIEIE